MRIRSFVSSAAIVGTLLGSSALVSQSLAQADAVSSSVSAQAESNSEQLEELKASLNEVIQLAETLKADNDKKAALIEKLTAQNAELQQKIEAQASSQKAAEKEPETDTTTNKVKEPVRSVVLGDVAATTAPEASSSMAPSAPAPKPAAAGKPEPKVAKNVPLPSTKPAVPAKTKAAAEVAPEPQIADAPEAASSTDDQIRKIDAAMAVIEEEMRNTDQDDAEQMQKLARQYAYLNAQRSYLTQDTAAVAEDEVAALPDATSDEAASIQSQAVNEAQAYEESLKARQDAVEIVEVAEPVEQPEAEFESEAEPEAMTVSQSADPFAEMSVESEDGEVLAEAPEQEPITKVELDTPAPDTSSEASEAASAPLSASEAVSLEQLLTAARVSSPENIKRVEKTSDTYDVAYQWSGGSIYGSAEQKALQSPSQFDNYVQDYLERTESRCPGEFAIVPDSSVGEGDLRADSYEVACVGDNVSSGASLLFFNQGGTFTVVAHEAPAAELDNAISARNQIRRVVIGG
ncbi:MAG: hypothetical protein JKY71_09010 [Alphaproteobacteria bacterium]|nr:hypothetical protein [Alphaproteobacteria bacterium]